MRFLSLVVPFVLILFSCNDDVNVTLEKEPGTLYGRVLPLNINSQAELYQGTLIKTADTDNDGYFTFSGLNPGAYRIKVKADNYGTVESKVYIEDGEGNDMGTIELTNLPYPLSSITPYDGATGVNNDFNNARVDIYFTKNVNHESFINALSILPTVEGLTITNSGSRFSSARIEGKFKFDQLYTIELDTTLVTQSGEHLEFPLVSTFTTEKLKIYDFYYYQNTDLAYFPIRLRFNGEIDASALDHILIEPDIPVELTLSSNRYIDIIPALAWPCDTTIAITAKGTLSDITGSSLGNDTTFTINMPQLRIVSTDPYHDQRFINTYDDINIIFNNIIDQSTLENAISIVPNVNYDIYTPFYTGQSRVYLQPDSLQSNTEFTVTVDTTLKGYYWGHLKEPYIFKFYTK